MTIFDDLDDDPFITHPDDVIAPPTLRRGVLVVPERAAHGDELIDDGFKAEYPVAFERMTDDTDAAAGYEIENAGELCDFFQIDRDEAERWFLYRGQ